MPTLVQTVIRLVVWSALTAFWSIISVLQMLLHWWRYWRGGSRKEVGLLGVNFFAAPKPRRRPKVLEDNDCWRHQFVQLSEIRMHYVESGDHANPLMVCLHGFPEFWYSYRFQLRHFQSQYHVVAVDLRGYGETEKPSGVANYNVEVLARDVAELIEKMGGKAIVVGHDWGGLVAWTVATHHPDVVDRLIVLNAPHLKAFAKVLRTRFAQLIKSWYMFVFQCPVLAEFTLNVCDLAFLVNAFRSADGGLRNRENFTDEDLEAWKYTFSQPNALTPPLNYYRSLLRNVIQHVSSEPVRAKTLLVWGESDAFVEVESAELSMLLCRDGRLKRIPNCSHWVQQDAPDQVNELIEEFLRSAS